MNINTHRYARHAGGPGTGGPGPEARRGRGRRGHGWHGTDDAPASTEGLTGWFAGRLPDTWFSGPAEVTVDRDEILVIGTLEAPTLPAEATPAEVAEAEAGRITRFRESTREERIALAEEAQRRYGRSVAWGARSGGTQQAFTTLSVPVMTRLRQPERQVLDTLVDAGVARSRSEALAWCVHLVGRNTETWLSDLREALQSVEQIRRTGPSA